MIETPVIVGHEDGIEGRPIALLVQEASQYASKVYIQGHRRKCCRLVSPSNWQ